MLTDSFFDWWFAPWTWAARHASSLPVADGLGQRDAYRVWCEEAEIRPDLPDCFDPAWSVAATQDVGELLSAARLFAGLVAARQAERPVPDALSLEDRKWCASISAIQPLRSCHDTGAVSGLKFETRGLAELACRLERGFPGMWPRLRLLLSADMTRSVDGLLRSVRSVDEPGSASDRRAQRCWRLCLGRRAETLPLTREGPRQ